MGKNKLVLRKKEVQEILKSDGIKESLEELCQQVVDAAGPGYEYQIKMGKKRLHAKVRPKTKEAKKDNLENNSLLKAFGK